MPCVIFWERLLRDRVLVLLIDTCSNHGVVWFTNLPILRIPWPNLNLLTWCYMARIFTRLESRQLGKITGWKLTHSLKPVINTFSATQTWHDHNLCKLCWASSSQICTHFKLLQIFLHSSVSHEICFWFKPLDRMSQSTSITQY